MALIPTMLLKRLYTFASLQNTAEGVQFSIKNRLSDARLTGFHGISIDGQEISNDNLSLDLVTDTLSHQSRSTAASRWNSLCARK